MRAKVWFRPQAVVNLPHLDCGQRGGIGCQSPLPTCTKPIMLLSLRMR